MGSSFKYRLLILLEIVLIVTDVNSKAIWEDTGCSSLKDSSNCDIYSCLDDQLGCTSNINFGNSMPGRFCERTIRDDLLMTEAGRAWARLTNKCLSLTLATNELSSCLGLNDAAFRAFHDCAVQNGFCNIFFDEREALLSIFIDRSWLPLVRVARECRRDRVDRFIYWSVHHILQ